MTTRRSEHYIDKGPYRAFRYEARGVNNNVGYSIGTFRTKEKALEAVLKERHERERLNRSWGAQYGGPND
jgi:hypothetical protein